jgi:uncharacterized cupin superfamily protein
MADHTLLNITDDVEDFAPKHGMPEGMGARFARDPLGLTQLGVSRFDLAPGVRVPFGHSHGEHEEVYVVVRGDARIAIGDEVYDLREWDAVRVPGSVMRSFEGGAEGAVIMAVGAPLPADKGEFVQGWWPS